MQTTMKESYLFGNLEETNDVTIAKIAGIFMCSNYSKNYNLNYKCLMPPNMYGPKDNYNLKLPIFLLLYCIYQAKKQKKNLLMGSAKLKESYY